MVGTPLSSAQFRDIASPILNETFDGRYDLYPKEYDKVFDVKPGIKRAAHEEPVLVTLGLAQVKGEGGAVSYDGGQQIGTARYVYQTYALAFSITEEMMEDGDHIGIANIYTENLADSMAYTKELIGANILNNGFNSAKFQTYDAAALFSTAHQNGLAATQSNTLTNPIGLSQAGLEQLLVNMRVAKDGRGKIVRLQPKMLVVPPQLVYVAERLCRSALQAGTANNDINAVKSINDLQWMQMSLLSSPTAWFIKSNSPRGLIYLDRRAITNSMLGDFETGNMRYKSSMRFAFGVTDFLGVFGTQGQ